MSRARKRDKSQRATTMSIEGQLDDPSEWPEFVERLRALLGNYNLDIKNVRITNKSRRKGRA